MRMRGWCGQPWLLCNAALAFGGSEWANGFCIKSEVFVYLIFSPFSTSFLISAPTQIAILCVFGFVGEKSITLYFHVLKNNCEKIIAIVLLALLTLG